MDEKEGTLSLAERHGVTPAELREAILAFPEITRNIIDGLRFAANRGAAKEVLDPVRAVMREMPSEDRELLTAAIFVMSGAMSGAGMRLATIPTDDIVRVIWGTDEACTNFDEIVAEHDEAVAESDDPSEPTQLSDLREVAEDIRRLFLRELFTEGERVDQKTAASAVHRAAERLGLVWLRPDSRESAARADLFTALGAFFAAEKLVEDPARTALEKSLAEHVEAMRLLPSRPEPVAVRNVVDRFLAVWDALHPAPDGGGR